MAEKRKASEAILDMLEWVDTSTETEFERGTLLGLKIAQQIATEVEEKNVEVKCSKWEYKRTTADGNIYSCNHCNREIRTWVENVEKEYPYCHCGAKMDLEEAT